MAIELYQGQWMREVLGIPQPPVQERLYFSERCRAMDPDQDRPECSVCSSYETVCPRCGRPARRV